MPDEKKELTPEQVAAQTAELESLKARFGKVVYTVDGKEHPLNLLDDGDFKKAQQYLAGGAKFAQDRAAFNAEKAAFDEAKKKGEAELKAKLEQAGKPADAGAARKKMSEILKENPALKQKFEDGDPTFLDDLGAAIESAMPTVSEQPKPQDGPTNEYVDRRIAYNTRILPDAKFQLLATKLGRGDAVAGAKMIAAVYKAQVEAGRVDADADYATSFLSVAHGWADELGLKVEEPKPKEDPPAGAEHEKETPPLGGGAGGGGGAGPEAPVFKTKADAVKWEAEQRAKKGDRGHSYLEV